MRKRTYGIGIAAFVFCVPVHASGLGQAAPLSDLQWDHVRSHTDLLDKVAYFPSLLPVIMKHRDAIGLSYRQTREFRRWRKENYQVMVDLMNEIILRRIELSRASLDAQFADQQILDKQQEIFELQARVLRLRLSCRQIIVSTFSAEQWENLGFVLEEYPRLAGLLDP